MNANESNNVVARVENLKVHYPIRKGFLNFGEKKTLKAVDGVSFSLQKGIFCFRLSSHS